MPPASEGSGIDLMERWKHLDFGSLQLDERDVAILAMLVNDSTKSNMEISERLGVTEGTVRRRIGKMERCGLIRGYSVRINYGMVERTVKAYVTVRAGGEHRLKVMRHLSQHPRCVAVYDVSGDHDIMAVMLFTSSSEFKEFAESHLKSEGIKAATVQVVNSAHKGSIWSSL